MRVTLHDWAVWKRVCSVAGCPEETRRRIAGYLRAITPRFFEGHSTMPSLFLSDVDGENPHQVIALFDSWMRMGAKGPRHKKDWMVRKCGKAGPDPVRLLGYYNTNVFCLLRAAVEDYLRKEGCHLGKVSTLRTGSLDEPVSREPHARTLGESLPQHSVPSPCEATSDQEQFGLAREAMEYLWSGLSTLDRLLLYAHAHGLSLNREALVEYSGVSKTTLYVKANEALETVRRFCREFEPENARGLRFLSERHLALTLFARIEAWAENTSERIEAIWGSSRNGTPL